MADRNRGRGGWDRRRRVGSPRLERLEERTLLSLDFVVGRGVSGPGVAAGGVPVFQATGVATSVTGDVYVAGTFQNAVDFEPGVSLPGVADTVQSSGSNDAFVAKYDAQGRLRWVRKAGGVREDSATGVAVDAGGNVYVSGSFNGAANFGPGFDRTSLGQDMFAWKLSTDGVTQWVTPSALQQSGINFGLGIAVSPNGQVVALTGFIGQTTNFSGTTLTPAADSFGAVVARLDGASGGFAYARQFAMNPMGQAFGEQVAVDSTGAIVTVGQFIGTIDLDPGGGVDPHTSPSNSIDAFVAKLDTNGNFVYGRSYGGAGNDIGTDVKVDAAGTAYVIGRYVGQVDFDPTGSTGDVLAGVANQTNFFVLQLGTNGAFGFVRDLGARNSDASPNRDRTGQPSIAIDAAGNLLATVGFTGTATVGTTTLTSAGDSDILVARLTRQGALVGAVRAGGTGRDVPAGLDSKNAGAVAFAGNYSGAAAVFGDKTLANNNTGNIAIARLSTRAFDDYDADQRADLAVYRPTTAQWLISQSGGGTQTPIFGAANTDMPVPADYDGDGRNDLAVFRPGTAQWLISFSLGGARVVTFGGANLDLPVPGDFDNDGRADLALYRRTEGRWLIELSGGGVINTLFGAPNLDQPVPADFNGDGRTDLAVFRPNEARWLVALSGGGVINTLFGAPNVDRPVPADYDGDNRADLAVFRPNEARWLIANSSNASATNTVFGGVNVDQPTPADFDGDGRTDLGVFRRSEARWLVALSNGGVINQLFGAPNLDVSLAAPVAFRFNGSLGNNGIFNSSSVNLATAAIGVNGGEGATGGAGQKAAARRRPATVEAVDLALESPDLALRPTVAAVSSA